MARKVKKKDEPEPKKVTEKEYQVGVTYDNPPDIVASYFYVALLIITVAIGFSVIGLSIFVGLVLIILGVLGPVLFLIGENLDKPRTVRTDNDGILLSYRGPKQRKVQWNDIVRFNLIAPKRTKRPEKKGKSGGVLKIKKKRTPIYVSREIAEQVILGYRSKMGRDPPK